MRRLGLVFLTIFGAAACGGDGGETPDAGPSIDAAPQTGFVRLTWTITDPAGAPITCDDVGGAVVELREFPTSGDQPPLPDSWSCSAGMGTTRMIAVGNYRLEVRLKNSDNVQMGETVTIPSVDILQGQTADVGAATFAVSRTGGVTFRIDTNAPGKNCDPETTMSGAGVVAWIVELRDAGGACVPAPEIQSACDGLTQACAQFENDVDQQITGIPSGEYTILVEGREASDLPCYRTQSGTFQVPGGDTVTDIGTITVPFDMDLAGCNFP